MQPKMAPWAFVLAVPDINKSAQYFQRDVFGFCIQLGECNGLAIGREGMEFG